MMELVVVFLLLARKIKPNIVHCHDTLVLPVGVLLKAFLGCRLIYDAHELESNKNGQTFLLSKGTFLIEKFSWRWIDVLISVSESIIEWYNSNLGEKKSILVLNSPQIYSQNNQLNKTTNLDRYFHRKYSIPEDRLVFVYLGIIGNGRGIEYILDVFSKKNFKANVVFVGYGDLSQKVHQYSCNYSNIHLHKPVSHDLVVELVSSADVGLCLIENVSLSDYYCLPNKLFEYAFAGLKVLGSDFPEIKRVITDYGLGVCAKIELEEVRDAIQFFIENPSTCISSDLTPLGWDAQAERLVKVYGELTKTVL